MANWISVCLMWAIWIASDPSNSAQVKYDLLGTADHGHKQASAGV